MGLRTSHGRREFGDYQTPDDFAERICALLKDRPGLSPQVVVEPTCGKGSFLKASSVFDAESYYGIEINRQYCEQLRKDCTGQNIHILNADIFSLNAGDLDLQGRVLVLGNPPWVTNSALSALGSTNLPAKRNVKNRRGIEAMTGEGNFDICESIILKFVEELNGTDATIAMLCKTSVARSVFSYVCQTGIHATVCDIFTFDAASVFGINVSACLLVIDLSSGPQVLESCSVRSLDDPVAAAAFIEFRNGHLYSSAIVDAPDFDGTSCFEWRQGVKHDCAKVMELQRNDAVLRNGYGELVDIEHALVFPLVKSSMFKKPIIHESDRCVIMTQKKVGDDTSQICRTAPKAWAYLNKHADRFANRKSTVYRNAPQFAMFGVGPYSYSPYKVGVSGFYKKPLFSLLSAPDKRPIMVDDTSYCICFESYELAYTAMIMLNSDPVQSFLQALSFTDSKRPYTKKVLARLDFAKICNTLSWATLEETEAALSLPQYLTRQMVQNFSEHVVSKSAPRRPTMVQTSMFA